MRRLNITESGGTLVLRPPLAENYAKPGDWEAVQPLITRMYVDQGKTLKEVMDIMANEYGHRGTRKMYKSRISKWGLVKNRREDDMLFILHKTQRRDKIGKNSTFIVRGHIINREEVFNYFARKSVKGGTLDKNDLETAPTPEHISYSTPPPDFLEDLETNRSATMEAEHCNSSRTMTPYNDRAAHIHKYNISSNNFEPFVTQNLPDGYSISCLKAQDAPQLFSLDPDIPIHPSTPQIFQVSDELLHNIGTYFDGSFQSGAWVSDDQGNCYNIKVGESKLEEAADFIIYCQSANRSIELKSYRQGRIMLSRACQLVKDILKNEDPRALDVLLEALLYMKQKKLDEVVDIIRRYISAMAAEVFARNPAHPWRRIWHLIGAVETEHVQAVIDQAWSRTSNAFDKNLGRFHQASLICYLEFLRYGSTTDRDEELALIQLLANCEKMPDNFMAITNILYSITHNLWRQNRFLEDEIFAQRLLDMAEAANSYEEIIWGLQSVCSAQWGSGKQELAEYNIRKLCSIYSKERGPTDIGVINQLIKLEGWLRGWGQEDKADEVHEEAKALIEQHADNEEDGVF